MPETQTQCQSTASYTLSELAYLVTRHGRRSVTPKTLRKWLPWALIQTREEYTERDLRKLVFVAHSLNRIRDFEIAQKKLVQDLKQNPHKYEENYAATIDV